MQTNLISYIPKSQSKHITNTITNASSRNPIAWLTWNYVPYVYFVCFMGDCYTLVSI